MKYNVKRRKPKKKMKIKWQELTGYDLASRNHQFTIEQTKVSHIVVMQKDFASSLVQKKVNIKYQKLVKILTELLLSEDDSGICSHEALNLIEKFRLEIKNKYRNYLKEKELKKMSQQLKMLKKVALEKENEIKDALAEEYMGKSR